MSSKESRLIKQISPKKTPIISDMILPNHSGDHVRSIKRAAPMFEMDLVNKKYVDDEIDADILTHKGDASAHHNKAHAATHETGGDDLLTVENIRTLLSAGSVIFSDGTNLAEDAGFFYDAANNRLAIGTAVAPSARLDLGRYIGTGTTVSTNIADYQLRLGCRVDQSNHITSAIAFKTQHASGPNTVCAAISPVDEGGSFATGIIFATRKAGSLNEAMRIDNLGRLGLGETSPDQELHIKGANAQICIEEDSTQFVRIGVEATTSDMCLGWDDTDDMHFGVFSSTTDSTITTRMRITSGGTVWVSGDLNAYNLISSGSVSANTEVSCANRVKMTPTGGLAINLINNTGLNTVAGQIVRADPNLTDSFNTAGNGELQAIGVVLEGGQPTATRAWVVVSGIADVLMGGAGCAIGDRIIAGAVGGTGDVDNGPAVAVHFQEVGHAIQADAIGGNLARVVIHFL